MRDLIDKIKGITNENHNFFKFNRKYINFQSHKNLNQLIQQDNFFLKINSAIFPTKYKNITFSHKTFHQ